MTVPWYSGVRRRLGVGRPRQVTARAPATYTHRLFHANGALWLQAMAAEGLCELSVPKTGEPSVTAIRRDAEAYRAFECWERTAAEAEAESAIGSRGAPLSLSQLYRPREPQKPVFAACGEMDRKARVASIA